MTRVLSRGSNLLLLLVVLIVLVETVSKDPYEARLSRAEKLSGQDKVGEAIDELRTAVEEVPERSEALIGLGKLLMSSGRLREAQNALEAALKAYSTNSSESGASVEPGAGESRGFGFSTPAALWTNVATLRYQNDDAAGAATACREALKLTPDHARCLYIYAVACLSTQEWRNPDARVESSLRAAIKLFSTGEEQSAAAFALGTLFLRRAELGPAKAAFEASLKMSPHNFEVLMKLGEVCSRSGDHVSALVAFQRAENANPESPEAPLQSGNALRRLKRFDQAISKYAQSRSLPSASHREQAECHYQTGTVLEQTGKKKAARSAYRLALGLDVGHARAMNNLASMKMAQGRHDEAVSLFKRAIASDPTMYEAYNNLGGELLSLERTAEAVHFLEHAVRLESGEPQLLFNLGLAYRNTLRSSEGVSYMRRALRLNPSNKDFYWELARTYNFDGKRNHTLAVLDGMTRTLRTGWHLISSLPEVYIHEESPFLKFYPGHSDKGGRRGKGSQSAVILYLCCGDQTELRELHVSLQSLSRHFTSHFAYPVVIFHDMLTSANISTLISAYGDTSPLSFERIDFAFPDTMPITARNKVPAKLFLAGHSWGLGYRHMSRFFSRDIFYHAAMRDFEYYLRLDADSFLLQDVQEDIFLRMARKKKVYGYMVVTREDESVVKGLWNATKEFIQSNGIIAKSLEKHLTPAGAWNNNMFYTNFEISRLDFWRSDAYEAYFQYLDSKMGIYMHRWGDAPIHLLGVALFLDEASIECFDHVPYWHQYYVNMPPAPLRSRNEL